MDQRITEKRFQMIEAREKWIALRLSVEMRAGPFGFDARPQTGQARRI
jgi:hypothetical protein